MNKKMQIVFVVLILLVSVLLAWYGGLFKADSPRPHTPETEMVAPENMAEITLEVEGMTCTGCENLIQRRVGAIEGVVSVKADHEQKVTHITYDLSRADQMDFIQAIQDAGYTVITSSDPDQN